MALLYATGVFQISGTGGSTFDVVCTDVDSGQTFQPKAIIMWAMGRTEGTDTVGRIWNGTTPKQWSASIGFGTSGSNRFAIAASATDGIGDSDGSKRMTNAAIITALDIAGVNVDGALDLDDVANWPANGYRCMVDDAFTDALRVSWCAWGGSDIENAVVVQVVEHTTTGLLSVTTPGFTVAGDGLGVCFFTSWQDNTTLPASFYGTRAAKLMFGAASGAGKQGVVSLADDAQVAAMDIKGYGVSNACIAMQPDGVGTAVDARASFNAWVTNGFQLNWSERISSRISAALVIKGGKWSVDALTTVTDTSTTIPKTGLGFQPKGGLVVSAQRSLSTTDTASDHGCMNIGAWDAALQQHGQCVLMENATNEEQINVAIGYADIYHNIDLTGAIEGKMRVVSRDSDGYTMQMSDGDTNAAFFCSVCWGPTTAGGGTTTVTKAVGSGARLGAVAGSGVAKGSGAALGIAGLATKGSGARVKLSTALAFLGGARLRSVPTTGLVGGARTRFAASFGKSSGARTRFEGAGKALSSGAKPVDTGSKTLLCGVRTRLMTSLSRGSGSSLGLGTKTFARPSATRLKVADAGTFSRAGGARVRTATAGSVVVGSGARVRTASVVRALASQTRLKLGSAGTFSRPGGARLRATTTRGVASEVRLRKLLSNLFPLASGAQLIASNIRLFSLSAGARIRGGGLRVVSSGARTRHETVAGKLLAGGARVQSAGGLSVASGSLLSVRGVFSRGSGSRLAAGATRGVASEVRLRHSLEKTLSSGASLLSPFIHVFTEESRITTVHTADSRVQEAAVFRSKVTRVHKADSRIHGKTEEL